MSDPVFQLPGHPDAPREAEIFRDDYQSLVCRTDRLLKWLMLFQWMAGIVAAIWIAPRAWAGVSSHWHPHIFAAVAFGGIVISLPVYLASCWPGLQITRHSIAVSQMMMSIMFIHLSGGRIETHFHLFGSLAFLSFYRDWRVLGTASLVAAIDHFVRGAIWPESIYGVLTAPAWRAFEHIGWIVFEDVFLLISIRQSIQEMHKIAWRQAALESTNARVEGTITERTAELTQEIFDHRRAEVALLESKNFLDSTVDALSAHIAILDENGAILKANQAWKRFAHENGATVERCSVGDNYLQVCAAASGDFSAEASPAVEGIRAVMEGRANEFSLEYPCHSPAEQRWFIMRVSRLGAPGPVRVVVAHENITARKIAEDESSRSRETLRGILDHIPQRVFWKNRDLVYLGCNQVLAADLGFSDPSEMVGKTDFDVNPREIADLYRAADRRVIDLDQALVAIEEPGVSPDGNPMWLRTSKVPLHDRDGGVVGVLGTYENVTAHKLAKLEIERLDARLVQSQKLETVGKLAGGVAHEFNTIMATIIGQCEMLLTDLLPDAPLRKSATAIRKAAERAASLTRQLLAYGRKQMLRPEILDLNSVLVGMQGAVRDLSGREIDVRLIPGAGLHTVKADAGQIEQVVINLAINAVEAMPNGGRLTIETANATLDPADLGAIPELKAGEYVRLTVSDNGKGMSETVRAHAFEPFFTTKDVGQGTGLGLSTCYGIIKQSGGHISVHSEPGRGASFEIFLPRVDALPLAPSPKPAGKSTRGMETILLMEMDDTLRTSAAIVLKKAGYTVHAVGTRCEGLSVGARAGVIDLLFTDLVTPQFDGQDLLERLRSSRPEMKTLFTSAHTKEALVLDGCLSADDEFLRKPYNPALLLKKTRRALDSENLAPNR